MSKFIIHIAEGSFGGTIAWQQGPNQVSSNFITGKNPGERCQMVDTSDEAWTQASANPYCLSSENAGFTGDSLTDAQREANAQYYARAHLENPTLPLRLMQDPGESGLGYHALGGASWGGHYDCPGLPIVAQLPYILDRAIELITNRKSEDSEMNFTIPKSIALRADNTWADTDSAVPVPLFEVGKGTGQWGNAWIRLMSTGIARIRVVYSTAVGWTGVTKDLSFAEEVMIPLPVGCNKLYIGRVEGDPLKSVVMGVIRYDR